MLALLLPQSTQTHDCSQLQGLRLLAAGEGLTKTLLGFRHLLLR